MGSWLLLLLRLYLRFVWFILAVMPGHVLILAHSKALARAGRPQSALLPITFYRVTGFVLVTVSFSVINGILARVQG